MKKIIKKILVMLPILTTVFVMLIVASLLFKPLGDIVFSITMGSMYSKAGETVFTMNGKTETLAIYKAKTKPFLIVGPCLFDKDYYDFFFVNKHQVIRTAIDKGGDAWFRIAKYLFMFDDMTCWDRVRAPYWDDLKCDKDSSVQFNKTTNSYRYSFKINSVTTPVSFAIPEKLLTQDMLETPNNTCGY